MINLRIVKEIDNIGEEFNRWLDQVVYGSPARLGSGGQTWTPHIDIYETPEEFQVVAEVPGLTAEDIEVVVDRSRLQIAGVRPAPSLPGAYRVHQAEILYGPFQRTFRMPCPIRAEEVRASFENGLLTIIVPREQSACTRVPIR